MKLATVKLTSASPMSQSRKHDTAKLDKELADAYEARTWIEKAHIDESGRVFIPAFALKMALTNAAKHSGEQIPGKGKSTWTKKFMSGLLMTENPVTNKTQADIVRTTINANADGVRGSGKRVTRHFPTLHKWEATATFYILDDIITQDVFMRFIQAAGMFIGVGQYRPENGGLNGRFSAELVSWKDSV